MTTIATLFSGGEGVGVGARAAGLRHLWGVEYRADIAAVAEANGFSTIVADVLTVDPRTLTAPDVLHASPVCKNASVANSTRTKAVNSGTASTRETEWDRECGRKVAEFVDALQPRVFTLENVYGYRNFDAFRIICAALERGGYMWDFAHLNAADFGVPQTRQRLFLRAVRGALLPHLPPPVPWVGWYEAIEDLLPDLPESQLAPWQLARVERSPLLRSVLINPNRTGLAWMQDTDLIDATTPAPTIASSDTGGRVARAVLVDSANARADQKITLRHDTEPSFTLAVSKSAMSKAIVEHHTGHRIVSMTPRALARLQSFPDSYILPAGKTLACTVIGNSVPPLMYQRLIERIIT